MKSSLKLVHPLPAERPKEAIELLPQEEPPPPPPFQVRHSGLIFLAIAVIGLAVILALDFFGPRAPVAPRSPVAVAPSEPAQSPSVTGGSGFFESGPTRSQEARPPIIVGPNREGIERSWATAVKSGDYRAIVAMLDHGASPNLQVGQGEPALERAALRGDTASVSALLAHGASVNVVGPRGQTPLMIAASNGHAEVVRLLVAYNASLDRKDNQGITALMRALWNQHLKVAEILITAGARLDITDDDGQDVLFYARQSRDPQIVAFVEEKLKSTPSKP